MSEVVSIGKVGVWLGALGYLPATEEAEAARELEALGFGALWLSESHRGREALSHAALLLAATSRVTVATGIASVWARDAVAAANGAASLAEASGGRFVLGLGVSHAPFVDARSHAYARPLTAMRRYLDEIDAASYFGPAPTQPPPRVLGALAPRMLELARDRADGAHPYLVTPEFTAGAREVLGRERLLAPEQPVLLERDPDRARSIARRHLSTYLGLDNYRRSWLRLGLSEDDFADGGSDRLVDLLVAWGDEEAVRSRVGEHLAAGADHVAVQALGDEPLGQLRRLAPALLD